MGRKKASLKWLLFILVILLIYLSWSFDLFQYLSLKQLKSQQHSLMNYAAAHPLLAQAGFIALYIFITGLSLPGAFILTLSGGMLFGFWMGLLLVSIGSTCGGTVAFLISRFLLRDWLQIRFKKQAQKINAGFRKEGIRYLLSLRFTPAIPYAVVNLLMGISPIPLSTFFWVTLIGTLPAHSIYVNAGTQLGQIESIREILSWDVLGALTLLGAFPFLVRWIIRIL
jgi:uncharacterized membrane protein YdjX (TVP38/TMEM64 family)